MNPGPAAPEVNSDDPGMRLLAQMVGYCNEFTLTVDKYRLQGAIEMYVTMSGRNPAEIRREVERYGNATK